MPARQSGVLGYILLSLFPGGLSYINQCQKIS